jgi:thymidine kinase
MPGSIEVIAGPMFSGKSEELIRRLRRAEIARLKTCVFKHGADDRYSANQVVSHSEWRIPSEIVQSAEEIAGCLKGGVHVVGIDEAQFFSDDIVEVVQALVQGSVRVIVAGLDLDYLGRPFGPMPQLLAIADEVTKLHAVCIQCGSPAHFSQRLVSSSDSVVVGGRETYEARCRRCFVPKTLG